MTETMALQQQVDDLSAAAQCLLAPCGEGSMPFRVWHPDTSQMPDQLGGEIIVLLHGGSGSWTHWIKNIPLLSRYYELVVPDLPGLGDASDAGQDPDPDQVARVVNEGLVRILGPRRFHLVGFSWGSVVASKITALEGEKVKSLQLIGPASMGRMPRPLSMKPLIPRSSTMSAAEMHAANSENLARLMIYDRSKIDPLAVHLQDINTKRSRFRSPKYSNGEYVLDALRGTSVPLLVRYGEQDAVAVPNLDARETRLKEVRPDAAFEVVPGVGHWLQYEAPENFNHRTVEWVEQHIFS